MVCCSFESSSDIVVPPIPQEELSVQAPPRHEETVETFKQTVANLADLSAVRLLLAISIRTNPQAAPGQMQRATRAVTVREEVATLPV